MALEASGRGRQLRAGHASAATASNAPPSSPSTGAGDAPRLAAAAQAAWDAGQPERALD